MSKLFVIFLLAAFLVPAGVFAASPDSLSGAINATGGTCVLGGNTAACGMMNTGTVNSSCSKGGAVDCDDDCSCGMMERTQGTSGAACCSAAGDNGGIAGISGCGMRGSWGQVTAGGAGRYAGWAALGFILVIILIIIWIIVGILLIINLYRKLSIK
jgi:hypothetical protein